MGDDRSTKKYVLAASRAWYGGMAGALEQSLGRPFIAIGTADELTLDRLTAVSPRYVFFPHWSTRIPSEVFQRFECVIFHMTDVPFGRGGSPLQNLIARGIHETKISALRCSQDLDAGPVYSKQPLSLYGTAEEIYMRAANLIQHMIADIVEREPAPVDQTGQPTIFRRRTPPESDIAEVGNLEQLFDHIRMLDADGYPHAFLETKHFRLEFRRASLKQYGIVADVVITKKI